MSDDINALVALLLYSLINSSFLRAFTIGIALWNIHVVAFYGFIFVIVQHIVK